MKPKLIREKDSEIKVISRKNSEITKQIVKPWLIRGKDSRFIVKLKFIVILFPRSFLNQTRNKNGNSLIFSIGLKFEIKANTTRRLVYVKRARVFRFYCRCLMAVEVAVEVAVEMAIEFQSGSRKKSGSRKAGHHVKRV